MSGSRVKLDIDSTRDKLVALGLSYAAEALDPLLAEAVQAELPAHVFLDRLLEAERSGREERRIKTMLKTAKIPTGQTLANFDFAFQPAIERSRIETLATGALIRNAEVILMQGPLGVGKSHLLCGLGIRVIQLGFSVQYFRFDELLTALRADAHLPPARLKRECPELCVSGPVHAVSDTQASKRSPNIMANWLRAANHSLTFRPSFSKLRMAR